jgi:hypothetical protein
VVARREGQSDGFPDSVCDFVTSVKDLDDRSFHLDSMCINEGPSRTAVQLTLSNPALKERLQRINSNTYWISRHSKRARVQCSQPVMRQLM